MWFANNGDYDAQSFEGLIASIVTHVSDERCEEPPEFELENIYMDNENVRVNLRDDVLLQAERQINDHLQYSHQQDAEEAAHMAHLHSDFYSTASRGC